MSLINQVLNDLEKRGASTRLGEATVRVVPLRQGHGKLWLLVAALAVPVLLTTAWLKWGAQTSVNAPPTVQATQVEAVVPAPDLQPAAVAMAKPLAIASPAIAAVSPDPAISLGLEQAVSVSGKNFTRDATLILRTPRGKIFSKNSIVMQDAAQIVFSTNFGNVAGAWSVEVKNGSGHSSAPYIFTVESAPKAVAKAKLPKPATAAKSAAKAATTEVQAVALPAAGVSKQPTQVTPQQQAENEFRKAYELMQQGQASAAISGYETALKLDAGHLVARQTLVRLLLENKRIAEAERLLQEGLQLDPRQSSLAMLLARIQVGRNELSQALETMQKSLPYAQQQADYQAFVAALLQRQNKHREAIDYYQKAVQLKPQSGVWLMGLGISLHAEQHNDEAREVFNRALESQTLSAELQSFVKQQLKEL